ncbi:RNA helicase [Anabaena cylindrica FACHB-243]|uniref:DSH domain protein n=1 Tax=Anabaena cylindrica (strain ATCC 27899 / PCC 7122) TaxID=272123 RepID=K9ZH38_ANACC|nr:MULTISPECIES: RNA helicase [Anabaena]AFZ58501.1 DSH domain protein [Anabaena cylindrica PCC 7122]MBD2417278.1 RNA helicase [Anabaena cylindrica FACHB-243]MBY5281399.1 RNA helicase [Anabaena sp. CCAP 1446/1C]MBY5310210.1 RNA helicase [Anabaena sp. CCAP 1446/1C]MCM2410031.1 RNA helicase [Anabaena sp. CCAP 1446/1C]
MNYPVPSSEIDLGSIFPFELDQFQLDAIASLNAGRSVVVCAPTGSGKTLIGEYAIYRALARGKRVFYTTPLKALSNQKLRDFREKFGFEQVGLLTGDASINRDAPILVMTTEIFRNMLYGTPIGQIGISLVDVEAVVLDECHYMNDRQRGTVWEESIIYCPREVQLVALSATVANSDQLTDWLNRVHGPTDLIYSDFRPVPLEFHYCNPKGLFPLLNDSNTKINPRLIKRGKKGKPEKGRGGRPEAPSIIYTLSQLEQRDMLPAIYFIFSRRGCDKAVAEVGDLWLVNNDESQILRRQIDDFLNRNPDAGRSGQIAPLYRGVAAHHAGILPAWKGLVEELFQQGLIKVVFATETLAAGINMPARTTVISTLSKRTDNGHRLLKASEFLQMSGRAGRRGMDLQGYVVTVQTPFEGAKEAAYLATSPADPLVSQFTPSYGMVLNLLQTHTLERARELIERSFGQYMATLHLRPEYDEIGEIEAELAKLQAELADIDENELALYEKLRQRLKVERHIFKTLQEQAQADRQEQLSMMLDFAISGTMLSLNDKNMTATLPITAILVGKATSPGQTSYFVCLGKDNRWYVATTADVVDLYAELPKVEVSPDILPPSELAIKRGQCVSGSEETLAIAQSIPDPGEFMYMPPEVAEQLSRVNAVQAQLENHPLHQSGNVATIFKRRARCVELEAELEEVQGQVEQQSQRHWEEFLNLIHILQQFGGLENLIPTQLGQMAAAIRGENELWLGLVIASGELDNLDPHHLAAAAAALVTETPRPDSKVRFDLSNEVADALAKLRGIRRQLFQIQRRYNVALPIWLEFELIAIVEQWALGKEWVELCANTTLDEGDVVRLLRRTLDLLSQIPHVPYVQDSLRRNAQRAMQLIDRFPVNEGTE